MRVLRTAAPDLLQGALHVDDFINADQVALGLPGFEPESAAARAGRIMLERIGDLASERRSFAFESTLSGRSLLKRLESLLAQGYAVHIAYLWLADSDLAVSRVQQRARAGGHGIPEGVIRRRFPRSVLNFEQHYAPLTTSWRLYDASERAVPKIAYRRKGGITVVDEERWAAYRCFVKGQTKATGE